MFDTSAENLSFGILPLLVLLPLVYYVFLAAVYVKKIKAIGKIVDQLPGPKKHWLYGNLHQHSGLNEEGLRWMREQVGSNTCFRMWYGPFRCVVAVCHPKTVRTILLSTEPKQIGGGYGMLRPWLGDGLLLSDGAKWFRNRRLLTPGFHFDVLKPYMNIYNEATDIFVSKLEEASKSGSSVDISQPTALLTLNIILRCAFSSDLDVQRQGGSNAYVSALAELSKLLVRRLYNPFMYPDVIYSLSPEGRRFKKYARLVHGVSSEVIAKRKATLKEHPEEVKKRHLDFLDILLLARDDSDKGLADREIRDEVDTFLFGGHDTTASAILWILYDLARHPHHQKTCREEVDRFLEKRTIKDVEWDDMSKMPFTYQCIRETLRLHSPVPYINRTLSKEYEIGGVKLPPGTFIDIPIHVIHHNEEVWGPDHNEFKPERFHLDRMEEMDPFAFVPFSGGPRNCIGQTFAMHEIKVAVAKVLNRFVLRVDPSHPVKVAYDIVKRSANEVKVFIEPRV